MEERVATRDSSEPERSAAASRFARDVLVNVLANLIASAVIYLLGAAGGLLPKSPYLIWTSVAILLMAVGVGLAVLSQFLPRGPNRRMVFGISLIPFGVAGVLIPFFSENLDASNRVVIPASGVAAVVNGVIFILLARRDR
ncbi:hypothetical protein ACQPYA_30670 [Micromonospora sp. CA-263727]|uniref:hypothetical protein n=1 Tax=Micromonospora sp. CA-263727 TaxID=3239967 RepID=UPI003D8E5C3A